MTINAPAACLLLLYELVGEEQGVPSEKLRGTTQNDVLKEYIARGNYIYPPAPTMRLTTDLFEYCHERVPEMEHDLDLRLPLPREGLLGRAGGRVHAVLAGSPTCRRRSTRASTVDEFAPRLAFFFNGHNNVFQEVAKFRAARRMWAHIMRERFGATNPKATMLRFHTQTGGVTLTAQQPENNIVRVALQGFAAVCGGTQSLHTNGFDEALALPTERAAKIALRTQQILAHESGATDTVDPFAGSYFVESLTDEIEARAQRADRQGRRARRLGATRSSSSRGEIDESAWGYQERYRHRPGRRRGRQRLPGGRTSRCPDLLRVDPESEREQLARLKAFKADRDEALVGQRLEELREVGARQREPAAGDPPGAQGPLLAGRGVRGDAGRVRQVRADVLSGATGATGAETPGARR